MKKILLMISLISFVFSNDNIASTLIKKINYKNNIYKLYSNFDNNKLKYSCNIIKIVNDKQLWEKEYIDANKNYRCKDMILENNKLYLYGSINDTSISYNAASAWISKLNVKNKIDKSIEWYISSSNSVEYIKYNKNKFMIMVFSINNGINSTSFFIANKELEIKHIATYEGIRLTSEDLIFDKNSIKFKYNENNFSLTIGD